MYMAMSTDFADEEVVGLELEEQDGFDEVAVGPEVVAGLDLIDT
jgi:hypothetical protein